MQAFYSREGGNVIVHDGPDKAPGPDGYTMGFRMAIQWGFQTHWDLLGPSVTNADSSNKNTAKLLPPF
jgi:hypothetical protein